MLAAGALEAVSVLPPPQGVTPQQQTTPPPQCSCASASKKPETFWTSPPQQPDPTQAVAAPSTLELVPLAPSSMEEDKYNEEENKLDPY